MLRFAPMRRRSAVSSLVMATACSMRFSSRCAVGHERGSTMTLPAMV
jgi:hypothetical protein